MATQGQEGTPLRCASCVQMCCSVFQRPCHLVLLTSFPLFTVQCVWVLLVVLIVLAIVLVLVLAKVLVLVLHTKDSTEGP